jgi:hypothetical protein
MTKFVPWLMIYHQRFFSNFFKVCKLVFGTESCSCSLWILFEFKNRAGPACQPLLPISLACATGRRLLPLANATIRYRMPLSLTRVRRHTRDVAIASKATHAMPPVLCAVAAAC